QMIPFLLLIHGDSSTPTSPDCTYDLKGAVTKYPCYPEVHCKPAIVNTTSKHLALYILRSHELSCEDGFEAEKSHTLDDKIDYWDHADTGTCYVIGIHFIDEFRCRKKKTCDLNEYFNASICDYPQYKCMLV
ncbi:hypothetical protein PENTCL1PPCAC_692, partial [Pristionchus entomophagus]